MFPSLVVSAFSGNCSLRTASTIFRVFDKNPFGYRSLSPRTSDYMASEDGSRTVPARCAAPVTSAESEVIAIFGNKDLADFEDAAKRTLEFAALPADAQSEKQQSEFPAGVPRPHVTRNSLGCE